MKLTLFTVTVSMVTSAVAVAVLRVATVTVAVSLTGHDSVRDEMQECIAKKTTGSKP
jgi:hypothetical protein